MCKVTKEGETKKVQMVVEKTQKFFEFTKPNLLRIENDWNHESKAKDSG